MSDLLGPIGITVDATSLQAQLAGQAQRQADAVRDAWFGHNSELAGYNIEAVREMGRHAR